MIGHRFLVRCSLTLLCGIPTLAAAQATSAVPFSVPFQLPEKVGNARLRDSSFVGDAMAYRYEGRRVTGLDVYVWPFPGEPLDAAQRDSVLQLEVAKFKATLPLGPERGWYDNYEIAFTSPHPVTVESDSIPGYVVAYGFTRNRQVSTSFFYIYRVRDMFVKIRLTVPGGDWNTNPALDLPAALVRAAAKQR